MIHPYKVHHWFKDLTVMLHEYLKVIAQLRMRKIRSAFVRRAPEYNIAVDVKIFPASIYTTNKWLALPTPCLLAVHTELSDLQKGTSKCFCHFKRGPCTEPASQEKTTGLIQTLGRFFVKLRKLKLQVLESSVT